MKNAYLIALLIAAPFVAAAQAPALPVLPFSARPQVSTTGMIGFTTNQTARLNVLNLNSVPVAGTTAPPNCNVQLQFFDGQNNSIKQSAVTASAPSTATSLDLQRTEVTAQTTPRAEIRGVVTVNPPATSAGSTVSPGFAVTVGSCSVKVTLEIFDSSTGSTVALTSDVQTTGALYGILFAPDGR